MLGITDLLKYANNISGTKQTIEILIKLDFGKNIRPSNDALVQISPNDNDPNISSLLLIIPCI